MTQIAVYPGTFDPITKGHVDVIQRAAKLFSQLIIAVALSERKKPVFNVEQRIAMVETVTSSLPNVKVVSYQGLSVKFAKEQKANSMVRGIRSSADVELELQLAAMNRCMAPEIETIFLPSKAEYTTVSATIVREIYSMQGDITPFVDPAVIALMRREKWL